MSLNTSDWSTLVGSNQGPLDPLLIGGDLEQGVSREEAAERAVAILMPLMDCGALSLEARQLRQVLLDNPQITTMTQLQNYLRSPERAPEHRSAEMDEVAQVLERWAPPRLFGGQQ
ncbi:Uncharacterised protein [Mycobacteroides abscessus subsp. abscessus]|uniref:hypothetical protein n=1 Tax=Mycobacteroides abscessus TaxID=36809 RepID=UPI000926CD8B|nr:hypothetical protein [Mycobacteroides abscessus]SIC60042.1 Uncharacterised protein [Mycobacteroides abscessus subsp. abscessus]SIC92127.1 Uncharacterised protein [Mycobacteroides abscessus subsp. abscessus]SID11894.1 Uncharacterised protein [Mycobacteroides abscessus subsp. abscessus]SID17221.1 Uncharacterised protein [Mycobacteroides abscessus subsp. abscessus]SKT52081.1 Uncharacterised protein [Mycobacteroides abscessus subsp. abscessus]